MGFFDIFFGSTQSQFTAYAILAAIIAICITILLTRTDLTLGNKLLLVFFVILTLVPSIFLILFEITCMVTGGNDKQRWWCWAYAWIIAVFIIIYCIFIIIISFTSLFTYNNAINKVDLTEDQQKMSPQNSNEYAKSVIETTATMEKFQADMKEKEEKEREEYENTPNLLNTIMGANMEEFNSKEVITTPPVEKPNDNKKQVAYNENAADIEPFERQYAASAIIQPTASQDKPKEPVAKPQKPAPLNNHEEFMGFEGFGENNYAAFNNI
jgi:hypothetical protein